MTERMQATRRGAILYDDRLLDHADEALFAPPEQAASAAGGRGRTFILKRPGGEWVLRHYRRGGRVAPVLGDRYLWTGLEASRPWREWRLLDSLYKEGLPVPQPVAARVVRSGLFYRGDLVTRRIAGARPLAELLNGPVLWDAVGRTLRRFHDAGVWHADLNAHNILLGAEGSVYLLDFDRGERRPAAAGWKQANLQRLKRSLEKLGRADVSPQIWNALLDGYRAGG